MKRYIFIIVIVAILIAIVATGIMSQPKVNKQEPKVSQVRAICDLATLKTYYHNVAKVNKAKGSIFQKDRELWIEYTGIAKIGIDMSALDMKVEDNTIKIFLPKAKLLGIDVEEEKINEYISKDSVVFKNKITIEERTEAINQAQNTMKSSAENNQQLLKMAQDRAQNLIERYFEQLSNLTNTTYNIEWTYEE